MRKGWMITICLAILFVITGCSSSAGNSAANPKDKQQPILENKQDKEGGSLETGESYGFDSFDLDIEVDGKDAVEIEFEAHDVMDSTYIVPRQNASLHGKEAMKKIHVYFTQLKLTKNSTKKEIIDETLKFFQLDHYSKFDFDVHFDDGTVFEIEEMGS